MITLLLSGMFLFQETEKKPSRFMNLLEWWTQDRVLEALALPEPQEKELINQLKTFQYDYQIHQTKAIQGRRAQNQMFLDPATSIDDLRQHYETKVRQPLAQTHMVNIQARLYVRERLNKGQISILAKQFPRFFSAKWFRQSRNPVFKGTVKRVKEKQ